eukprot:TRINITY_DN5519_c0_g1_i1.p1 TRINITY_DN5519_c0_g1~~TRINITY_DN5519_c0_g1_i1.p1  ORF type:complete len:276 (-),score=52.61 TRINITY_DN5519_c0_g1_i1:150-977(-)
MRLIRKLLLLFFMTTVGKVLAECDSTCRTCCVNKVCAKSSSECSSTISTILIIVVLSILALLFIVCASYLIKNGGRIFSSIIARFTRKKSTGSPYKANQQGSILSGDGKSKLRSLTADPKPEAAKKKPFEDFKVVRLNIDDKGKGLRTKKLIRRKVDGTPEKTRAASYAEEGRPIEQISVGKARSTSLRSSIIEQFSIIARNSVAGSPDDTRRRRNLHGNTSSRVEMSHLERSSANNNSKSVDEFLAQNDLHLDAPVAAPSVIEEEAKESEEMVD